MITVYIPKGESRTYESLVTDKVIVNGHLHITHGLKARIITGSGVVEAGDISADIISLDEVECARITCKRLLAKRVNSAEVFASDSVAVSCFLCAAYVRTGRLTAAISEVDVVDAEEVIQLRSHKHGMLVTLLVSALRALWLPVTNAELHGGTMDAEYEVLTSGKTAEDPMPVTRAEIAKTVRQIMREQDEGDFELKRIIAQFKLLREQGYTLRIIPGTPEENAPKLDADAMESLDEVLTYGKAA